MARETALLDKALAGAVGLGAGAVLLSHALDRYRERSDPAVVCGVCGESMPVEDVLDPTVTCECVAARGSRDLR